MSDAAAKPAPARGLDPLGAVAYAVYVALGGFFVFAFAWAIAPAVERQQDSTCRALNPEVRDIVAPDFVVQDLKGNEVRLSDYRGKFVVLNFWATWCPPCITEWPQVHQLGERLAGRDDVVVIALSIDKTRDVIAPFLARMAMADTPVEVLWDPNERVHTDFGTKQLPDTYFIDEAGVVRQAYINARKWGTPSAVQCVESMIGR